MYIIIVTIRISLACYSLRDTMDVKLSMDVNSINEAPMSGTGKDSAIEGPVNFPLRM